MENGFDNVKGNMKHIKPIQGDKLPQDFGSSLKTTKISAPVKERGQILKTMARLKLEHKFRQGFKHKMNEVVGAYEKTEAVRKSKKKNQKYADSDDEVNQSPGHDASVQIEDLFGRK